MKEKKTKNHKENWIGNIIRGFLLFMPLLAIGVTCAYAIFNKNAYQSYDGSIQYQKNVNVERPTDLLEGRTYNITVINNVASQTNNASYRIGFSTFTLKDYLIDNGNTTITNATYFTIGGAIGYTNNSCFTWYDSNLIYLDKTQLPLNSQIVNNLQFQFTQLNTSASAYYSDSFKELINVSNNVLVYENTLSNVFYYSIDKIQQSPLFNWATETGMYNVIHEACTTLGIETTFVPFLLAYWLLTYLIYIIYDIALLIVNMAHNRIHDVESSI